MKKINYLSFFCHCEGNIGKTPQLNVIASVSEAIHKKYHKWIAALPLVARNDAHGKVFKSKVAFTLAEVLITLTIIGVIAALTIPNLMQKWQEQHTISAVKEAYSLIDNALKQIVRNEGELTDLNLTSDTLRDKMGNYLKITKTCEGIATGCILNEYKNFGNETDTWTPTVRYNSGRAVLANGMAIAVNVENPNGFNNVHLGNIDLIGDILVDINGNKAPNRYGYDVFFFAINSNGLTTNKVKYNDGIGGGADALESVSCQKTKPSNTYTWGRSCARYILKYGNLDYQKKTLPEKW